VIDGTARLELSALRDADFEGYYALYADPRVALPTGLQPLHDRGAARKWFEQARDLPSDQGCILALRSRGSSTPIGVLRLTEWNHQAQHLTLGYALAPSCWGQGLMQECLSAVLPDVFAGGLAESVRRVQAWVLDDNGRSSGLLQKLGFRHEGTLLRFAQLGRCTFRCDRYDARRNVPAIRRLLRSSRLLMGFMPMSK
jgi:ribosomal-protein-alanine N-acetyltransferase